MDLNFEELQNNNESLDFDSLLNDCNVDLSEEMRAIFGFINFYLKLKINHFIVLF